ncbi:DUF885 domain-containing protein [Teredinibacter sp. KSP-S5-2]|uniref:DUF885 domain-containing protein n=1 Tax=Teredinibacter sp. KSP-S5-2 TaxID=3034506 RepID=UPI0029347A44|nr:DUF885 domain-containing protein [Teredinibacter sp. KSP-S5-2]WNO09855.1 DUF885 domain-containing protein [Teredinibacter sp. KSP-S5-2]
MKRLMLLLAIIVPLCSNAFAAIQSADQQAEQLFSDVFESWKSRSPEFQTELGLKTNYDKWDENTPEFEKEGHKINIEFLRRSRQIAAERLTEENRLSLRLLDQDLNDKIEDYKWRYHWFPVNQMFGRHTGMVSLLIDQHSIDSYEHAIAYIERTKGTKQQIERLINTISEQEKRGIIPPKFVFPHVIQSSKNLLTGQPFDTRKTDSPLLADFKQKIAKLELTEEQTQSLIENERQALNNYFQPAYQQLIKKLQRLSHKADNRPGIWKQPKGKEYYLHALKQTTTTDLSPEEIHQIGLQEVKRIHQEMMAIAKQTGFKGSLQEFFDFMGQDKQFYYPNNEAGKKQYLVDTQHIIGGIKERLPELFNVQPKADLIVKQVEAYREKSAGIAFYYPPAPDGSRPGIYYANLSRMEDMPKYSMEALAYHEALPGHHMQIAIAQERQAIPDFRKYLHHTAYVEGWGLYSELIPKEIGLYTDPYSDFGRLKMEILRACRLVTDTGIHAMKWDKNKAVNYLLNNMPITKPDAVKAIERYAVMPSQATAYKVGMLEILRLREFAKTRLGDKFDIRDFHDVVLKDGSLPLNILEEQVSHWAQQSTN